ncbi:MAG: DUF2935 domain-containing protein [Syntrophomonadaceae bacterium]
MSRRRISASEFVQQSLDLHLFFLRIMKEHAFFLQAAFLPINQRLIDRADEFRRTFERLLEEAVELADGNVSADVLRSGEVVTNNTIRAEKRTQFLSGIPFDIGLTRRELRLTSGRGNSNLERRIERFNDRVIRETMGLIDLKTDILRGMLNCTLFTFNFPLLIEHIRREARFYVLQLQRLQRRIELDPAEELIEEKVFWDRIMAEHSLFIAHLLDPTERELIRTADDFARRFFRLEDRAREVGRRDSFVPRDLIRDEIRATRQIRDFKETANELILDCRIRSIIIPLLADHVLREANHFLALLKGPNIFHN